ncbi:hypothetical protein [Halochromatium glycolicum]|uniref:Uncharacterized protein n=1 Tax=Halochromatium glycolicum TaxID=85075 RepID=A0AAJ0U4S6_9GAMM|nr:hypothetical protein [Halochromatium glycolicum]MBK1705226.1 hypothetical protein [Halochromatium glycolicum]
MGEFSASPDLHEELADDMPTLEASDLPDFLRGADGSLCPEKSWTEEQLFTFNLVFDEGREVVRETLLKACGSIPTGPAPSTSPPRRATPSIPAPCCR